MRWAVEVQQTGLTSRNLEDLLGGLGFNVISGPTYPAITSAEMQKCVTAAEAFDLAKRVLRAMVGAARVDDEFRLGSVIDFSFDPPRRQAFLEAHSLVHRITGQSAVLRVRPPKGLDEEESALWEERQEEREYQTSLDRQRARLEPAFRSENAEIMLELLAERQPTGETLYKIYELAEGHVGNRVTFQATFGISKTEFERFEDAVHNPKVTGRWARHAYSKPPKTANPMSKAEAEAFVRNLAEKWLDEIRRSGVKPTK